MNFLKTLALLALLSSSSQASQFPRNQIKDPTPRTQNIPVVHHTDLDEANI
jgi:hypothetical protein